MALGEAVALFRKIDPLSAQMSAQQARLRLSDFSQAGGGFSGRLGKRIGAWR